MKLPSWVKIIVVLVLLSVAGTVVGAVSPELAVPIVVICFILFPGPNKENPRIVRWAPWFWALDALVALVFGVAQLFGKDIFPAEAKHPSMLEVWGSVALAPILIWTLVRRHRSFKPLLVASSLFFVTNSIWEYSSSSTGDLRATIELGSELLTQVLVTAYFLMKVRPQKSQLATERN